MIRPSESVLGTHLNSVWMEGTLVSEPVDLVVKDGPQTCSFRIEANQKWEPASILMTARSSTAVFPLTVALTVLPLGSTTCT